METLYARDLSRVVPVTPGVVRVLPAAAASGPWSTPETLPETVLQDDGVALPVSDMDDATLADAGFVVAAPAPGHDPATQHPPVWDGTAAVWVVADKASQEVEAEAAAARAAGWSAVREKRTSLLTMCDWTQLADAPLSPEARAAWAVYRTALRDLPATYGAPDGDPAAVVWPAGPEG